MQRKYWRLIAGLAAMSVIAGGSFDRVGAVTTVLYDGALGGSPTSGANPYLNFFGGGIGVPTAASGVTRLDTSSDNVIQAGYTNYKTDLSGLFNSSFPAILDNNAGYTLSFTVRVNSQTNASPDRAGFSVIVLGSDNKGIEIGFRNTDIFSQNDASFNSIGEQKTNIGSTLTALTTYNLNVLGGSNAGLYTLTSETDTLLSGSLRDYTAAATGALTAVYAKPNFIFLGDDTTSAGASVDVQRISLTTNPAAVPEPSSLFGIGLAIGFGARLKQKLCRERLD
ncbi:PEP-CTERM sorting domain-containing protein [Chamaesiphon sp. OTE_75_metabat_556]|uniref:PEP-CTERM sorting domain-containing protein n=1 Tax=Chamaesiphon sp. OTE_75_metabat_556 TaxID=2964692 RepID=UPI00286B677C|nr:PEP-CTERM sorting domain-containing protein [Chamaesiphon sp. OTE_75_metabat_556]